MSRFRLRGRAVESVLGTPSGAIWQLDFTGHETAAGGTWRIVGCRDYFSKYENRFHVSPTAIQHDAIDAAEQALAENEELFGYALVE